jgi:hypothetical protein
VDGRLRLGPDRRLLVTRPPLPGEADRLRVLAGLAVPSVRGAGPERPPEREARPAERAQDDPLGAGVGVDHLVERVDLPAAGDGLGQAADAVAAHLGPAAVGVIERDFLSQLSIS